MSEELKETNKRQGGKGIAIAALGVGVVALLMSVMAFAANQGKSVRALEEQVSAIAEAGEVQDNHLAVLDFRMARMQRNSIKSYVAMHELAQEVDAEKNEPGKAEADAKQLEEIVLLGAVGDMASKAEFLESRLSKPEQKEALSKIKELLASMQKGDE